MRLSPLTANTKAFGHIFGHWQDVAQRQQQQHGQQQQQVGTARTRARQRRAQS